MSDLDNSQYSLMGELVLLRVPLREDYDAIQDIFSDRESMRALIPFFGKELWSEDEITERFEHSKEEFSAGTSLDYAVVLKKTGRIVGNCGLKNINLNSKIAEFGIILDRSVWGHGVSSECHVLCLDYCFEQLQLEAVHFTTDEHNLRMQGFFNKHGIRFKGTTQEGHHLFVVDATEWPAVREKLSE